MKPALLLVDLQNDFLQRPNIFPEPDVLLRNVQHLASHLREANVPIVHIHTVVSQDGSNRMPHWKHNDYWACAENTDGCLSPSMLAPQEHDLIVTKQFYSAFDSPDLDLMLEERGVDTLIVAGLFTHGCVRSTVLDAYTRGYTIWVADDAVGSNEPEHAAASKQWLDSRAARFKDTSSILVACSKHFKEPSTADSDLQPAAYIGGEWIEDVKLPRWQHLSPTNTQQILAQVPLADHNLVHEAATMAAKAQTQWRSLAPQARFTALLNWSDTLEKARDELANIIVLEIGKPITDAKEEVQRAVAHIRATVQMAKTSYTQQATHDTDFEVRDCPVGVIGLITPWNNPVAIPAGKIAPALVFGNTVTWKPALPTSRTTRRVMQSMLDAGLLPSLVSVVFGDAATARCVIRHHAISAVTLTGSNKTGHQVSMLCSQLGKPLQAELGGNNAAIIMPDADLKAAAASITRSAFGFSGQRCTATRRIIVASSIKDQFLECLISAISEVQIGEPGLPSTQLGPLISREHRDHVMAAVNHAVSDEGARLLVGGNIPDSLEAGCWYAPTVIEIDNPGSAIIQEETFGPVAIIQTAMDIDEAITLCNGVPHGLVASLYSKDHVTQQRFREAAQAGILSINPTRFDIHPDAPFGGWKASGIGPPEHGVWDAEFYTRPQVIYDAHPDAQS